MATAKPSPRFYPRQTVALRNMAAPPATQPASLLRTLKGSSLRLSSGASLCCCKSERPLGGSFYCIQVFSGSSWFHGSGLMCRRTFITPEILTDHFISRECWEVEFWRVCRRDAREREAPKPPRHVPTLRSSLIKLPRPAPTPPTPCPGHLVPSDAS